MLSKTVHTNLPERQRPLQPPPVERDVTQAARRAAKWQISTERIDVIDLTNCLSTLSTLKPFVTLNIFPKTFEK